MSYRNLSEEDSDLDWYQLTIGIYVFESECERVERGIVNSDEVFPGREGRN